MVGCRRAWTRAGIRFTAYFQLLMNGLIPRHETLDFDYAEYAARHFARLAESASDPRYPAWLRHAHAG
jgi:hypothetical protein